MRVEFDFVLFILGYLGITAKNGSGIISAVCVNCKRGCPEDIVVCAVGMGETYGAVFSQIVTFHI